MNQTELSKRIAASLRASGIRKPVATKNKTFTVSSDSGESKTFTMIEPAREVPYTVDDIQIFLEMFKEVLKSAISTGEKVMLSNFGSFRTVYFKQTVKRFPPGSDNLKIIPEHYAPKFEYSQSLKAAAKKYSEYLMNQNAEEGKILSPEEDDEFFFDFDEVIPEEPENKLRDAMREDEESLRQAVRNQLHLGKFDLVDDSDEESALYKADLDDEILYDAYGKPIETDLYEDDDEEEYDPVLEELDMADEVEAELDEIKDGLFEILGQEEADE